MSTHSMKICAAAAAVLGLAALSASGAHAATTGPPNNSCFPSSNWESWNASRNGDVIYLRVKINDVYRVDLTPGSHVYRAGDTFLVNELRGSGWICSALDLDLTLADHHGFRQPVIARSMRKLSAAEIAAIPPKERP
jgi:hypothetical protein